VNFFNSEPCKCCEVYKSQLEHERALNQELLTTISSLLKPQVVVQASNESTEFKPIESRYKTFSSQRARLEREDRERAALNRSTLSAKPDSLIDKLEEELKINETEESKETN